MMKPTVCYTILLLVLITLGAGCSAPAGKKTAPPAAESPAVKAAPPSKTESARPRIKQKIAQPPGWVMMPEIENGLAATFCVRQSGNWSADKQRAVLEARGKIVGLIGQKIHALDQIYRKAERKDGSVTSSGKEFSFHSVMSSAAVLSQVRMERIENVVIQGDEKLCIMMVLEGTEEIFEEMIREVPWIDEELKKRLQNRWSQ